MPALPADVAINHGAGRGDYLFVTVRLEDGEDLPFVVDTGAGGTLFDTAFAPQLGRRRGAFTVSRFGVETKSYLYARPKFYLGGALLQFTGDYVGAFDLRRESIASGRTIMGVLGMDCLEHYIIQLDFDAGKMRFLDRARIDPASLGQAFALTPFEGRPLLRNGSLLGGEGSDALVDTGCKVDGALQSPLFEREIQEQCLRTNQNATNGRAPRLASLPQCIWNGGTYTNLVVANVKGENLLGLRFLARHLVTLDFPGGKMYLKQISAGPAK